MPQTVLSWRPGESETQDWTVPSGPPFALTFMQFSTGGGGDEEALVQDLYYPLQLWDSYGGDSQDINQWNGLHTLQPGHTLQVDISGLFPKAFWASGYFYSRPSMVTSFE